MGCCSSYIDGGRYGAESVPSHDWQRLACAHADLPNDLVSGPLGSDGLDERADALMHKVFATLETSPAFNISLPPFDAILPRDSDWSFFAHMLLARVEEVNQLGGPRLRLVHWTTLDKLGRMPRWPDDAAHVLDAADLIKAWIDRQDSRGKIADRILCISMFSHRWSRPSMDPSKAHPDTENNIKARSLAHYGRGGLCAACPNHLFDYFFWIDWAGVNQSDRVAQTLGIAKLPMYVAVAVEVCFFHTAEYEARAWTRLERALGFVFCLAPMFVMIDDKYFEGTGIDLPQMAEQHSDCFAVDDGSQEAAHSPLVATGGLLMHINDPRSANTTQPKDKELINKLITLLLQAKPVNMVLKSILAKSADMDAAGSVDKDKHAFLDFNTSKIAVDTEHYRIDCEIAQKDREQLHLKRAAVVESGAGGQNFYTSQPK